MLTVPIESEIEQERKIIKGFTARQAISAVTAVIFAVTVYARVKDIETTTYIAAAPVLLIIAIGWVKINGQRFEDYARSIIYVLLYRNSKRKYRTRNEYFDLLNSRYHELKSADMNNKKAVKLQKKEAKRIKKLRRKAKIKALP